MTWLRPCPPCGVHPRVSGENSTSFCRADLKKGSSPRERGKLLPGNPGQGPLRIIPARAGKTPRAARFCVRTTDHPRSRGENEWVCCAYQRPYGSSPLARGKPMPQEGLPGQAGIIPARAGKTSGFAVRTSAHTDHPRSRGENLCRRRVCLGRLGSSPLARGKRRTSGYAQMRTGIIPARAGKTQPNRVS